MARSDNRSKQNADSKVRHDHSDSSSKSCLITEGLVSAQPLLHTKYPHDADVRRCACPAASKERKKKKISPEREPSYSRESGNRRTPGRRRLAKSNGAPSSDKTSAQRSCRYSLIFRDSMKTHNQTIFLNYGTGIIFHESYISQHKNLLRQMPQCSS